MDDPAAAEPGSISTDDPSAAAPSVEATVAAPGADGSTRPAPPPQLPRFGAPSGRVVLLAVAALVVCVVLYLGRDALGPFVVGLMLIYLLTPPIEWLHRFGLPRALSILLVYAAVVLIVVEGLNLTLRPLVAQIRDVVEDLPRLFEQLQGQLERIGAVYRGLELPPAIREAIDAWLAGLAGGEFGFDPSILLPILRATTGFFVTLVGFLIVPVWGFYLIKDRPRLTEAFDRSLPPEWRTDVWAILRIIERVFSQWVRGQLILGLAVGVTTFAGLLVLAEVLDEPIFSRFAVLLAVSAGILELLPIIGPIIAAVPAILLAATAGLEPAAAALLLYLGIQQLENNLLVPKIQGDAVELHPSAVMLSLIVGGAIAGLLGAILALPITAAARDVYRYLFRKLSEPLPATTGIAEP